ncbi:MULTISPECIES: Tol-Pal system protein TolB [Campylobacter]|uniref:Tol-Pal system protein TolB n=1 Tax=Campylobacter porcelli TaxID=1660073 RepID=A0ABU7M5C4_9BACT|nr:Tol-Pal system protein TolB [Campylobacter sp. P0024]MCR8679356.1 Tol-Pal system protein TolB [Campylobacter sp. RM19072]MEE3705212.1 Tol-Pal system protein TolB [Campylobacter sp. CX2-8023-23]MEE3744902.1 Tol-Pal system protein TolB [Campylobacter sp. CX2-4855-23]MEE3777238.1 Tol-Pal system protein TolB [Campylobacter sp. CX2-4080-23]
MKKLFLLLIICLGLSAADATIDVVNKGLVLPKIIVQDATTDFANRAMQDKFFKLVVGDLKVGSAFEVSDRYYTSKFDDSAIISADERADLIYRYALTQLGDRVNLKLKVLNAKTNKEHFSSEYTQSADKFVFLAHKSMVDMARNLNLPPIDWMDKSIIFSQYTAPGKSNIVVADYTLTYQKVVVSGGLNIFPKWANKDQSAFYYTSYIKSVPTLYKFDLKSNNKSKILQSGGMIVASDVSQDGTKLLLTMAPNDQSDIYLYDIISKNLKRITTFSGIDVNGNFVDNDTKVVFVSDRLGYPNIFATSIDGGAVEQMVFHGKNNNSISTFENYVVYSSRESINEYAQKTFNLYLISTKSDYVRQLTAGGVNTYPRFSSDGGSIIFIKSLGVSSAVGIIRVNENRSFQFPLRIGKLQSIDW